MGSRLFEINLNRTIRAGEMFEQNFRLDDIADFVDIRLITQERSGALAIAT
ncbi:hypothetical protein [Methanospirillum sp.]